MKFSPDQLEELRGHLLETVPDRIRRLPGEALLELERTLSALEEIYSPHQSDK